MDKEQVVKEFLDVGNTKVDVDYVVKLIYNNILNDKFSEDKLDYYGIIDKFGKFDGMHYAPYHMINSYKDICREMYYATKTDELRDVTNDDLLTINGVSSENIEKLKSIIREYAETFVEKYNAIELDKESFDEYFSHSENQAFPYLLFYKKISVEMILANSFADFVATEFIKDYIKDSIGAMSDDIVQGFADFGYDDCKRSIYNVDYFMCPSKYRDLLFIANNLRRYPQYNGNLPGLVGVALADKIRSSISKSYNQLVDLNNEGFEKFAVSHGRRFNSEDIKFVCDKMMEYYVNELYNEDLNHEFVEKFANKSRDSKELRDLFNSLYNINNFESENKSMEFFVSQLCEYIPEYLHQMGIIRKIDEFEQDKGDIFSYVKGKAGNSIQQTQGLGFVKDDDQKTRLQTVIESMDDDKKQEVEEIVLQYVRDKFADMDGIRLARGVLSEDFIKAHKRELIKIVSNSNYNDNTALSMISDIMKGNVVYELPNDDDLDM